MGPIHHEPSTLPELSSPFDSPKTLAKIQALSRRGKLPNFAAKPSDSPSIGFSISAFGHPFDHILRATIVPTTTGSSITFSLTMARRVPIIMAVVILLTIWPGVWLTDSMLTTYFSGYDFATWMWYIPITVAPIPFMWRKWHQRSVAEAKQHAAESIEVVRSCLIDSGPATA